MGNALGGDGDIGNTVEKIGRNFGNQPVDEGFEVRETHSKNVNGEW
jgi:hypothetical protein